MTYIQMTLFKTEPTPSVVCSECSKRTFFPGCTKDMLPGCTYDCACGKVMRIERTYATVDLFADMAKRIKQTYGVDVDPNDIAHIDLGD